MVEQYKVTTMLEDDIMNENNEKWINIEEAADYLGVKSVTIRDWIRKNKGIPSHKIGRQWKFKITELDQWVNSGQSAIGFNDNSSLKKLKCASFFAGVGGIDLGFESTGVFETVYANEFDPYPAMTFELNNAIKVDRRDIHIVKNEEIPDFDVMLAGFPCQAFSIAGLRKGFGDEKGRGELFFELVRILNDKRPRIAFFENVKNLVNHDNGNTFKVICEQLDELGYKYTYKVLNPMEHGNVAQNRERIYIVAFRDEEDYERYIWPTRTPLINSVMDIIDFVNKVDERYYYTEGKYKDSIYQAICVAMADDDPEHPAVYQWRRQYVRKNQSGVVPTLTANQGEGGHNVCLIKTKYGIRKMTPRECFNTQGFPKSFKLPDNQSDARLYKQAGNSVCVSVIGRIAESIACAIKLK